MSISAGSDTPAALDHLYDTLAELRDNTDGPHTLAGATGHDDWPESGIYFFFTAGTDFDAPPSQWQLSRIGTVGVSEGSANELWPRLRQHRGNASTGGSAYPGGGNHRGSIWRKHVGRALIERDGLDDEYPHWGTPHRDGIPIETTALREQEHPLEEAVSAYIRRLPFLVVEITDEPGPQSDRAYIEKNTIALVSQSRLHGHVQLPDQWLGNYAPEATIRKSGLWNIDHVGSFWTQSAIDTLREYC